MHLLFKPPLCISVYVVVIRITARIFKSPLRMRLPFPLFAFFPHHSLVARLTTASLNPDAAPA